MKKHTVTIKDIARELDISPSTVSRALKDHAEISKETKEAVNRVAKELNYQPNSLALSLRYSKSHTIGIVVPEIVHFFFSTVISGIEDVAHAEGYNIIITQSNDSFEREASNLQTLFNNRVDGILISISEETRSSEHLEGLLQRGIPIVCFDRNVEDLDVSKVVVDDFSGGYQATEHLIKQGYKKIAHLAGPESLVLTRERHDGYKKALEDNGIKYDKNIVLYGYISEERPARDAMKKLIKDQKPDAVFAASDVSAMGAMNAATGLGMKVPDDFGVVGFSNWQFTSITHPSISTIEQRGFEMGQKSAELLIKELNSEEETFLDSETIKLTTRLIHRESSNKKGDKLKD
ncbi:MAG: LacI family DNA-binding transcriptional regulator [Cyclobacteriaceae bacterium]